MALLNTHPDYMNFDGGIRQRSEVGGRRTEVGGQKIRGLEAEKMGLEEYPAEYYKEFLEYVKDRYEGQYWHVLPREMGRFWKEQISLRPMGGPRSEVGSRKLANANKIG